MSESLSGLFDIGRGVAAEQAFKQEASDIKKEAALVTEESRTEADRVRDIRKREIASNKLQFLKQGVKLQGTPLDVLAESEKFAKEEADAIIGRGEAQFGLGRSRSKITRRRGRSALFSGFSSGISKLSKSAGGRPGGASAQRTSKKNG